jgi:hypothetical protein
MAHATRGRTVELTRTHTEPHGVDSAGFVSKSRDEQGPGTGDGAEGDGRSWRTVVTAACGAVPESYADGFTSRWRGNDGVLLLAIYEAG